MLKKIFPVLILSFICAFAMKAFENGTNPIHAKSSEIFVGIYAASVWNSNDAEWNEQAATWTGAGATISGVCVKAALAGSGAGPLGTIICGAAVGL